MLIQRDFRRTEHDDFLLNVQDHLDDFTEAVPCFYEGEIIAWKIQYRFE